MNLITLKIKFCIVAILISFCFANFICAEKTNAFRFGVSAPLSGVLAEYGIAVLNGIELAKKDNPDFFQNIKIIFEDSQWDPKTAIAAFNKLKNIENAHLIYNWGNPTSEAVAPIAEQNQFPILAMSSDPMITDNRKYIIRTVPAAQDLGLPLGNYLKSKKYKKVAVVLAENTYVQGVYEGLQNSFAGSNVKSELLAQVSLAEQDFKTIVTKIKNNSFDCICVFLITGQLRTSYQQLNQQNIFLPSCGADFLGSQTEIKASGKAIEGAVFPDLNITPQFREKYFKVFSNDIQIAFAANAYDVVTLVAQTFASVPVNKLTANQILDKIQSTPNLSGAHGNFYFQNKNGDPTIRPDILMRQVKNQNIIDLY